MMKLVVKKTHILFKISHLKDFLAADLAIGFRHTETHCSLCYCLKLIHRSGTDMSVIIITRWPKTLKIFYLTINDCTQVKINNIQLIN